MLNAFEEKIFWFISKSAGPKTKNLIGNALRLLHKTLYPSKTFTFESKNYRYFSHNYNLAWRNERTVEVPIVWREVRKSRKKLILEVGNVLSHYFPTKHDVVDKYEKGGRVINKDILDFKPSKKYDLVVSISTIEHIQDPLLAIKRMKKMLKRGGQMLITFPIGYNKFLDKALKEKKLPFNRVYYLKKISRGNKWKEVDWEEVKNAKFGKPFLYANAVVIGITQSQTPARGK